MAGDLLAREVDHDVTHHQHLRGLGHRGERPGTPQRGDDPGEQFLDAERFGQVVVRVHVQSGHLVPFAAPGGDDDDPDG
jgi:hypothetical protein